MAQSGWIATIETKQWTHNPVLGGWAASGTVQSFSVGPSCQVTNWCSLWCHRVTAVGPQPAAFVWNSADRMDSPQPWRKSAIWNWGIDFAELLAALAKLLSCWSTPVEKQHCIVGSTEQTGSGWSLWPFHTPSLQVIFMEQIVFFFFRGTITLKCTVLARIEWLCLLGTNNDNKTVH